MTASKRITKPCHVKKIIVELGFVLDLSKDKGGAKISFFIIKNRFPNIDIMKCSLLLNIL